MGTLKGKGQKVKRNGGHGSLWMGHDVINAGERFGRIEGARRDKWGREVCFDRGRDGVSRWKILHVWGP